MLHPCIVSPEKKKKKNINNDLAILPSHDIPKPAKVYLLSLVKRNSFDIWINKELRKDYIHPSTSPIAALFFFVKKYDGSLQPVDGDQRELITEQE